MVRREMQGFCGTGFMIGLLVVFACLLLAGAPRLIGRDESSGALPPAAVHAALVSAPAPGVQTDGAAVREQQDERQAQAVHASVHLGLDRTVVLRTDANGNVLGHRSYLHTVYRAFALGDGFA